MNHNEWEPIYKKIEQDFSFSIEKEKEAGDLSKGVSTICRILERKVF